MGGCVSSRKGGVQGAAEKYLQLEPGKKSSTAARVSHYIDVTSNDPEEQHPCHASTVACISPAGRLAARALCLPMPLYQLLFTMVYKLYDIAPKNLVRCIFGVCLTFFGGTYVASLAAIEAHQLQSSTWTTVLTAISWAKCTPGRLLTSQLVPRSRPKPLR